MVRNLSKHLPRHFWNEDKGLTSIFILVCISNFLVIPFFGSQKTLIFVLTRGIWIVLLFAGITTLSRNRSQMRKYSIIPALLIASSPIKILIAHPVVAYIEFAVDLAAYSLLIGMVLVKVFENGSVTIHRVIGSIVVYMLIGNAWSLIYQFIYSNIPGSIQFPASDIESGINPTSFLYFSYTTLTTTGFGDILPLHPLTRTMVIIEQLVGVLYPVVLIGRLVSLVVEDSASRKNEGK